MGVLSKKASNHVQLEIDISGVSTDLLAHRHQKMTTRGIFDQTTHDQPIVL